MPHVGEDVNLPLEIFLGEVGTAGHTDARILESGLNTFHGHQGCVVVVTGRGIADQSVPTAAVDRRRVQGDIVPLDLNQEV